MLCTSILHKVQDGLTVRRTTSPGIWRRNPRARSVRALRICPRAGTRCSSSRTSPGPVGRSASTTCPMIFRMWTSMTRSVSWNSASVLLRWWSGTAPYTQALALRVYSQARYNGLRWGSLHRPQWRVYCLREIDPRIAQVDELTVAHIAVESAARALTQADRVSHLPAAETRSVIIASISVRVLRTLRQAPYSALLRGLHGVDRARAPLRNCRGAHQFELLVCESDRMPAAAPASCKARPMAGAYVSRRLSKVGLPVLRSPRVRRTSRDEAGPRESHQRLDEWLEAIHNTTNRRQ